MSPGHLRLVSSPRSGGTEILEDDGSGSGGPGLVPWWQVGSGAQGQLDAVHSLYLTL